MRAKPYDPLRAGKRTWRSRLMVPGAIGVLLLVVAAGTTLTVIGVMRLLDSSGAASGESRPLVPLPTAAPTPVPTAAPTVAPTAIPTAAPTPVPTAAPASTAVVAAVSPNRIADVFERLKGSVVRISTASENVGIGQPYGEAGSGFVIDGDGHILTNYHVIEDGRDLYLTLDDGTPLSARVVGVDPGSDVALLRANIPSDKLVVAPLGSSAAVRVGDQVMAIGSQFFVYRNTMTEGYVSGMGRHYAFSGRTITGMIQSNVAINRGSSGGPLIDVAKGEVVGINTAIRGNTFAGIALALPIDRIKRILPDLLAGNTPTHAWLPVYGASITPQLAAQCSLPVEFGVIVYGILPGSTLTAETDETKTFTTGANGDIIVGIDDRAVRNLADLSEYLDTHKQPGDVVEIRVYRERKENRVLEIALEEWPNRDVQPLSRVVDCSRPASA